MHVRVSALCLAVLIGSQWLVASDLSDQAHRLEEAGDSAQARQAWTRAIRVAPDDAATSEAYAEFLERYKDPRAREAYRASAAAFQKAGNGDAAAASARRAYLLDLIAGDRASAEKDLASYQALAPGAKDLKLPPAEPTGAGIQQREMVPIPGPLRSFARMTAVSPDIQPDELLTALARNLVLNGYQATKGSEELEETEYLKLIRRYLTQARELDKLAGAEKTIRITSCESAQTGDLLRVLGFRMRGGCGSDVILETVNAARAFITTDSGFPVADLEQALRTDKPFAYDYHPASASVVYGPDYWLTAKEKRDGDFIDAFLSDPGLCRFYLGMTKLDPETADGLRKGVTPVRLRAMANVLDFFGGNFELRDGHAVVPGGARATQAWADMAGVSPEKGPEFFERLMARDDGWLASLYDALARIQGPVHDYLTDPVRLKRLYSAVRGRVTTPGPARPVFRSNAEMMLLTTRLRVDADGRVHIPGGLDVWKELFEKNPKGRYDARLSRAAANWRDGDDVVEALFAMCRKPVDNEPLNMFMTLTDIDRNRAEPLKNETIRRLVKSWSVYGAQFAIFNDVPTLTDKTIVAWMDLAASLDKMGDPLTRQDGIGTMQGLTALWQIFCRQGSIPADKADETLAALIAPFSTFKTEASLFDIGRGGVNTLMKATGASTGTMQDRMLSLIAGGPRFEESDSRTELMLEERHIFEAQKLLTLDLLFEVADNLQAVTRGEKMNPQLAARLSARVAEIQLPRNSLTGAEKNAMAFGYFVDRHVEAERKVNLRAMIDKAAKDPEKIRDIRGQLAPMLRDTIVGYSYVHFAPPGAQVLMTNPLFVRGHDFVGMQGMNHSWKTTEMYGTGWPSNAGGRLVGSLSGLPYALAEAEQNFLVPTQTQALIWGDLVPQMLLAARAPRFWTVKQSQMHWVGIHMRAAEALIAEAAADPAKRDDVERLVGRVASPYRAALVNHAIDLADAHAAIEYLTPSEMYNIALYNIAMGSEGTGPLASEIAHLKTLVPDDVNVAAISRAWGTPKPTLANSYRPELLNLKTFPTLMGYSSRIMAESWESNLLYWADVGDQIGVLPAQLNLLVPEWTRKVVERIFASHLEDWPALLRSLRSVGDEVRTESVAEAPVVSRPALEE